MNRIARLAGIAAFGLAVTACGKSGGAGNANLSDADNMLVPADENATMAADANVGADDAGAGDNMAGDNMSAGNAQ